MRNLEINARHAVWEGRRPRRGLEGSRGSDKKEGMCVHTTLDSGPRPPSSPLFFFFFFFGCGPFLKSLLNLLQHCFCFMFWFFGRKACGILALWPGIRSAPCPLEGKVSTTGPAGKSPWCFERWVICSHSIHLYVYSLFHLPTQCEWAATQVLRSGPRIDWKTNKTLF